MQRHTRTIASAKDCRNKGVFWVFEHPRNFRQKFDAQKCRLKHYYNDERFKTVHCISAMFVGSFGSYRITNL